MTEEIKTPAFRDSGYKRIGISGTSMLVSRIKSQLPRPIRRPLGSVWRALQAFFYYLRGKKILLDYTRHYHKAQRAFKDAGGVAHPAVSSIGDVGVRVVSFGVRDNVIDLPDDYLGLVERVSESVNPAFGQSKECSFFPGLPEGPIPERTEDIPAIRSGEVIIIQLKDPFKVDGLEDLCRPIMRELERKIYGAYLTVENVYLYRSPVSRQTPRVSWLWHFDNHPYEVLKVMIYLTDVDHNSAPFEFLSRGASEKAVSGSPIAPLYGTSRIPDSKIQRFLDSGFERRQVTGPRGTMILFDNDVIHRGTLALQKHRDVLIFQIRPFARALKPYIDQRWTGSFQHADFSPDPSDVVPAIHKPRGFSR